MLKREDAESGQCVNKINTSLNNALIVEACVIPGIRSLMTEFSPAEISIPGIGTVDWRAIRCSHRR